jgi:hypothetical protein
VRLKTHPESSKQNPSPLQNIHKHRQNPQFNTISAHLHDKPHQRRTDQRNFNKLLGQALEYGYFNPKAFPTKYLDIYIVAPAELSLACHTYLQTLKTKFGLPIQYCIFRLGSELPPELAKLNL